MTSPPDRARPRHRHAPGRARRYPGGSGSYCRHPLPLRLLRAARRAPLSRQPLEDRRVGCPWPIASLKCRCCSPDRGLPLSGSRPLRGTPWFARSDGAHNPSGTARPPPSVIKPLRSPDRIWSSAWSSSRPGILEQTAVLFLGARAIVEACGHRSPRPPGCRRICRSPAGPRAGACGVAQRRGRRGLGDLTGLRLRMALIWRP